LWAKLMRRLGRGRVHKLNQTKSWDKSEEGAQEKVGNANEFGHQC